MKADDPLVEVFERNRDHWEHKKVLIAGHITSMQLLPQLIGTTQAYVLSENYETAQGLSAMMGVKLGHHDFEYAQKKHVTVIFGAADDSRVHELIDEVEVLVLFLSKTKSLSQNLLYCLQDKLAANGKILLIGSNAIGGKSGDGLIKYAADVYKIDTARKCTVFLGSLNDGQKLKSAPALKDVLFGGLTLKQAQGIFSQGELDQGTKLLLNAMHHDLSGQSPCADAKDLPDLSDSKLTELDAPVVPLSHAILDVGCGSGIIGLSLAARGFKQVVCSDISATALNCTVANAQLNGLTIDTLATNMLPTQAELEANNINIPSGKFNIIATNPPFHQGVNRTTSQTLDMIAKAKNSLTSDGVLYLVGNACLHYEEPLAEAFTKVQVLAKTTKFVVYKASNK